MEDEILKIHIIGCSGSGKSYLARELSKKYHIQCYDLDNLQWDNESYHYGVKMNPSKRNALLQEILKQENWIIEGVYYKWVGDCFRDADIIYILKIPPLIYKYRILKRFVRRKLKLETGKKETFSSVLNLIRWTDEFETINMKEIEKMLKPYEKKVHYLQNKQQIRALFQ